LIKFGQDYQQITDYKTDSHPEKYAFSPLNINQDILSGNYLRENDKDYLVHSDGRKINISYASSGQQESLPLVLMLNYLQIFISNKVVVFIEEPEAHLFPSAQKKIVELIAATFNANPERDIQFIITTHSPQEFSLKITFQNL
jgi:predicted ATPase